MQIKLVVVVVSSRINFSFLLRSAFPPIVITFAKIHVSVLGGTVLKTQIADFAPQFKTEIFQSSLRHLTQNYTLF